MMQGEDQRAIDRRSLELAYQPFDLFLMDLTALGHVGVEPDEAYENRR